MDKSNYITGDLYAFDVIEVPPPKNTKINLITKYGIQHTGIYQEGFHIAWYPLLKIPKSVKKEIGKKARNIFMLTNKGVKATFTNLPEFIKDIENELETKIER